MIERQSEVKFSKLLRHNHHTSLAVSRTSEVGLRLTLCIKPSERLEEASLRLLFHSLNLFISHTLYLPLCF